MTGSPRSHNERGFMPLPAPRIYFLQRLRKELLGPKNGPDEELTDGTDPREEYTTGVLDCADAGNQESQDQSELIEGSQVLEGGDTAFEEDEDPDPLLLAAEFAPSVDPRRLPCSIGLTFFVEAGEEAFMEACVSGGRYRAEGKAKKKRWRRHSKVWALEKLPVREAEGNYENEESGLRVVVRTRRENQDRYRISIYLLNIGKWEGQTSERASRFLYQPQIRICLTEGAKLLGLSQWNGRPEDPEEGRLQLLYHKRPVKARGHMCAAVWQEIDAEQEPNSPFDWIDSSPELERFARSDLRTELLPMLAVAMPDASWRSELGPSPLRDALALSHTAQSDMREALQPLIEVYRRWTDLQEKEARKLPEHFQALAAEQIQLGREAATRMEAGIELLAREEEVYLAFCFANRAVHDQAAWGNSRPLSWRPFQLGFILLCLPGLSDPESPDRDICDLLWFPTGGGKTEAYLALTAFTLGLRRLRHQGYDGVGVVSRYTLRLLSIQQFRRALKLLTACEMLRITPSDGQLGWRPPGSTNHRDWLWGKHRFSTGLWLGGAVTPNQLEGNSFLKLPGGFDLLEREQQGQSEPAQITDCPVCGCLLALDSGTEREKDSVTTLYLRLKGAEERPNLDDLSTSYVEVTDYEITDLSSVLKSLKISLRPKESALDVDTWWSYVHKLFGDDCRLLCVRASRPGYFIEIVTKSRGALKKQKIEIFCPNPDCATAQFPWRECLPMNAQGEAGRFQSVHEAVALEGAPGTGRQCPIPAVTVDDQIYAWPPSLLISTVDKFARLAFEPRAANLFGNVEYYHAHEGFYRQGCLRQSGKSSSKAQHPSPPKLKVEVAPFPAPDLIIQDELHLIDGPLGSMVGLYETAVSLLCGQSHRVKYVASTATVREATDQVQALFARSLRQFPPPSLDAHDSFFALMRPGQTTQQEGPGRLYLGFSAPGRGSLTPQVRIWAVLLQAAEELRELGLSDELLDPYWTPVGYYTAIRNLASAGGMWRQSIPMRMEYLGGGTRRQIGAPLELSSRVASNKLPGLLNRLSQPLPNAADGVLSTSMFGTGVDVSRLSLMLVNGQPKTTSSYIQATGRVGRQSPGLVVVNLPATNPRALDHFEFFTGYHHQLYRGVEPVTVFPYAPRAREKALGPLCVALLRQLREVDVAWRDRCSGARLMSIAWQRPEVQTLISFFEERAQSQPELRRPDFQSLSAEVEAAIANWRELADKESSLQFEEYSLQKTPEFPVVLGDPQHLTAKLATVFANAPQSLREVEPTTGFQI